MEKRIRRLGIFMLLCLVALFVQLNNIQVLKANSLATNPQNPRVQLKARNQPRGDIVSSDGVTLATSMPTKSGYYKYQRVYNPNTAVLFSQIVGYDSIKYGNFNGVESEYNSFLVAHNRPAKSLRDLLTNQTVVDNVTLTINSNLQRLVAQAVDTGAPGVDGAAAVVLDPTTGAILAMYSNPTFDPNPLVSTNLDTETAYWNAENNKQLNPGNPLRAGAYNQINPPGSSFKVVTTSAVLQGRPDLAAMTYPVQASTPLPDTGTPPQVLTNYQGGLCGGTLEEIVIQSCDADFAFIGEQLGATALVDQAQAYGFNQRIPLDVPSDTVAASNFGTVADFSPSGQSGLPGLMKSAIGQQNVSASALQMAMVAGTVANGGVEMTPHVMAQIRDSQGNLVETYTPKPWMRSVSSQTAATLTTFMQGVVTSGTAAGVGFPASWNVAAKTGTAQVGSFGPNPTKTTDWLIAFAPNGASKVAVAVVLPNEPGSATGATYSGPIVKEILNDILGNQPSSGGGQ
ncbi:MAG TPA: penicillin-binding transpeptidase domain-containing protein [Acidimicrobiales bacterium]|jgi:peptidoglycan glycosyltransferase|nr:penicillin-binding transpeptidase domain-containing protein [Acidimicrobiales bacterium]